MHELINRELATLLSGRPSEYDSLFEGARYTLLAPGKRIRPLLTLYTAEMIEKGSFSRALHPACSLEMVHCYSLIHDDLPCMDNDDFRRGRPTLHKVYNEAHAVLVGDFLLTYSFEILSNAPDLTPDQKIALIHCLSQSAGGNGMIGGQIMDIEKSQDVSRLHQLKTGALFRCALAFGGIVAKASPPVYEKLIKFGEQFGELFQLADDIQDDDHFLGKEEALKGMRSLHQQALKTLNEIPFDTSPLKELLFLIGVFIE